MISIGILGFADPESGAYATAVNASPHTSLSGIADTDPIRGRKAAEEFSSQYFHRPEELLAADIEAVVICAENSLRHKLTVEAGAGGKHVLCGMPMATSLEEAEEMVRVCREKDRVLAVGLPFRCSSPVVRAREIVQSGRLGEVLTFKIVDRAVRAPAGSQGPALQVADRTAPAADLVRWLIGSEVGEVYAEIGQRSAGDDTENRCLLTLTLENGVFGMVDYSRVDPPRSYSADSGMVIEITGTDGFLSVDAFGQKVVSYNEKAGAGKDVCWGDDMYLTLVRDFTEAVSGNRPPAATGDDGLRALKVAFAARRSAEEKQPARV